MAVGVLIVTICYVLASVTIGVWKLRGKDYADFVACPGKINKYAISLSICGTVIGGGLFFTIAQMGHEAGLAVLALPASYIIGYVLLGKTIPKIRQVMTNPDVNTLYDVIDAKLSEQVNWAKKYRLLLSVVTFGMYYFMLSAQFTIVANFYVNVLSVPVTTAWILSLAVIGGTTLAYSVAGGLRKDIATDVFQVIVVLAGIIILAVYLIFGEGVTFSNVPRTHFAFTGYGVAFPIAVLLFFSPAFVGRFDYWQRVIAAKSSSEARFSLWFTVPIIVFAYIVCCLVGIASRSMAPETEAAEAAVWFIRNVLPPGVSLVVTLSFYAALMSTSDTLLNVSSVSFSSILQSLSRRDASFYHRLSIIRLVTVAVGITASITVLLAADTIDLIIGGFSSLVILAPGLLYTLFKDRPDARVPFVSLAFGYLGFVAVFVAFPALRKYAFIFGFLLACLFLGIGYCMQLALSRRPIDNDGNPDLRK